MVKEHLALSVLCRQSAAACRRGVPWAEVARALAQDPEWPTSTRVAFRRLAEVAKTHPSLTDALSDAGNVLPPESVQLLRAADVAGQLPSALDALAEDHKYLAAAERGVRLALAWPATVACVVVVILVMLAVFVVPSFIETYASFNTALPEEAALFMAVIGGASRWVWLWLPLLVLFVVAWRFQRLPRALTQGAGRVCGAFPFVRRYHTSHFAVRLVRWLQWGHGEPVLLAAALAHLRATTSFGQLQATADLVAAAANVSADVVVRAIGEQPSLPPRLGLWLRLGQRLGDLPGTLAQLAEVTEDQAHEASEGFERGSLLAVYAVLACVVVLTMVAMYLPIFKLGVLV